MRILNQVRERLGEHVTVALNRARIETHDPILAPGCMLTKDATYEPGPSTTLGAMQAVGCTTVAHRAFGTHRLRIRATRAGLFSTR